MTDFALKQRYRRGAQPPEEVAAIRALILRYIDTLGQVSLETVYSDESEPMDMPMYEAVEQLLAEGVIVGPALGGPHDHTEMVYRRGST